MFVGLAGSNLHQIPRPLASAHPNVVMMHHQRRNLGEAVCSLQPMEKMPTKIVSAIKCHFLSEQAAKPKKCLRKSVPKRTSGLRRLLRLLRSLRKWKLQNRCYNQPRYRMDLPSKPCLAPPAFPFSSTNSRRPSWAVAMVRLENYVVLLVLNINLYNYRLFACVPTMLRKHLDY